MLSIPPPDTWAWLLRLFGPPRRTLREAYTESGDGHFDHGGLDALLRVHVNADGFVDYAGLAAQSDDLDRYLGTVATVDFSALSRDEKLALLINIYNAATLRLVLDNMPLSSIKDIRAHDRWKAQRWVIGGRTLSLEDIENTELRAKFIEPRIHFAINCASNGCPKLRNAAFTGDDINAELDAQTRDTHTDTRWCSIADNQLALTKVYRWYEGDFVQSARSVHGWVTPYLQQPDIDESISWLPYDWSLNSQ